MKRGPQPGVYLWRSKEYHGVRAVAAAAGVTPQVVVYHLDRHGHLDRLGIGHSINWPADGRGSPKQQVSAYGRDWPSVSALAREIGHCRCTVRRWLATDDDRLLAALMSADASRTAAALRDAEMVNRVRRAAA